MNRHICGSFSLQPIISGVNIGQHLYTSNLPQKYWKNTNPGNIVYLRFLTKNCLFSNVLLNGLLKFAMANGTYCQVIDYFIDFNLTKFSLPSKNVKIVSGWSFTYLGKNSQTQYRYTRYSKAGYLKQVGKKPKVRGVARNPVDHPHGGRTKTNQPEVSIWG